MGTILIESFFRYRHKCQRTGKECESNGLFGKRFRRYPQVFSLPVPSTLQHSSGQAANGQKANLGQYMTTGHHLQCGSFYIIPHGLSRGKG